MLTLTRDQVKEYVKEVAKADGLADPKVLQNVDDWALPTIRRIIESRRKKYDTEAKQLPVNSPRQIELAGKIWSLDEVLGQLSKI